jgi:hypothetical protein
MAKKTDELVVEIKSDASDLIRTFDNIQDRVKDVVYSIDAQFNKFGSSLDKVTKGFAQFGLAVQGVKTAMAPFEKVIERLNSNAGLANTAKRIGVSVERLQELNFSAKRTGVSSETLSDAIKDLNIKITDASKGAKSYEEALNVVGLSSKELIGLSVDEQFNKFADAMANASAENRRFVADEINDSMFQLVPLLEGGSAGMKKLADEARELGVVLREEDIAAMREADIALKVMISGFTALGDQLIVLTTGPLKQFADAATEAIKSINDEFKTTATPLQEIQDQIREVKREIEETQEAINPEGFIDSFFSSEEKRAKAKEDLEALNAQLKELQEEASKLSSAENAAVFDKVFNSTEETVQGEGGGATFGGVSDEEEAQAIDDIGKLLGLSKTSAEAMAEAMEFEETLAANIAEAKQRAADLEVNIALQKEVDKVKAAQDAAKKEIEIEKMKQKAKADILRNLSSLMNTENRKMFEVGKAAAIAQSIMNTYQGATKALAEVPYPYNFVAAASVVAAGLNNVNNIRSQSFGGAGAGAASTGGAEGIGAGGDVSGQQQGPTNVTEATINITGDNISGDSARALVAQLREYQEDGGELVIK